MELTKKSETSTKITFTYDKPAGTEGYLYFADGKQVSRTFNPNDLEVTFGKVASGKYAVEAVSFNTLARAEWPKVVTPPLGKPSIPTGLTAVAGDAKVTLSWNANPASDNVTGYQVYRDDSINVNLNVQGLSYVVTGLTNGQTYTFRISAGNAAGYGEWSVNPVTVTPQGTTPPPPSGFASPLGFISNRSPGYFPTSNIDKYGVISSEGPPPVAFRGLPILYVTGVTCQPAGYTNISEQECLANNWAMHDAGGNPVRNSAYGGVLADIANPAYQRRWAEKAIAYARAHGAKGFWIDDTTPQVTDFYGGPYPVEHPSFEAYKGAMLSFMQANKAAFAAAGFVNATYNSSIASDDDASKLRTWLQQCGGAIGGMCVEYWMTRNGSAVVKMGAEWYNHFPEWRGVHTLCRQYGIRFDPVTYGSSVSGGDHGQSYVLAAYLLDWEPGDGGLLWSDPDASTTQDPWSTAYAQAFALGVPTAATQESSGVFTRRFQNGTVTVNANTGTATIALTTGLPKVPVAAPMEQPVAAGKVVWKPGLKPRPNKSEASLSW